MRDSIKPASLAELMGEGFEHKDKLFFDDLPKLLGEKMPEIEFNRVGRLRLLNALHGRFGAGFRNIPSIKSLLDDFDKEIKTASLVKMNRRK